MQTQPAHANVAMLERFYGAFAALDADAMAACYADDARFDDEVFSLRGRSEIGDMWEMLCRATRQGGRDAWALEFSRVQADVVQGQAHWEARYRFSATGRAVHNRIDAGFEFRDGMITAHRGCFDFWTWSRQALGAPGWLLGWTPFLRNKVRAQAASRLQAFREVRR